MNSENKFDDEENFWNKIVSALESKIKINKKNHCLKFAKIWLHIHLNYYWNNRKIQIYVWKDITSLEMYSMA